MEGRDRAVGLLEQPELGAREEEPMTAPNSLRRTGNVTNQCELLVHELLRANWRRGSLCIVVWDAARTK
jgi:hypothetical protein